MGLLKEKEEKMTWLILLLGILLIGVGLVLFNYIKCKDKKYWDWGESLYILFCWLPNLILLLYIKIAEKLENG